MTEKIYTLKDLTDEITDLESKKEVYKESPVVNEYIKNKYILDYYNEKSESLLENEDFIDAILTMDKLTRDENVKSYIKICERLKFFKNVKSALLSEYAAKQKTKK